MPWATGVDAAITLSSWLQYGHNYEAWAADEFRSVNAQIEAVLVDAARPVGALIPGEARLGS